MNGKQADTHPDRQTDIESGWMGGCVILIKKFGWLIDAITSFRLKHFHFWDAIYAERESYVKHPFCI